MTSSYSHGIVVLSSIRYVADDGDGKGKKLSAQICDIYLRIDCPL